MGGVKVKLPPARERPGSGQYAAPRGRVDALREVKGGDFYFLKPQTKSGRSVALEPL